jgi:DNA-binding MarR family transcriptional regulator
MSTTRSRPAKTDSWPLAQRPGFLVRRLHQIHVALFARACGRFGLTPVQYSLLSALATHKAADQSTLAADIALDKTTTAGALRRLERRGLVRRAVSRADRRARLCALTRKGAAMLVRMEPHARRAHLETIATLTAAERATLLRLLTATVAAHAEEVGPL